MERTDIKSLTDDRLREAVTALGCPAYRAAQIRDWLNRGVSAFEQMHTLPRALRETLEKNFYIPSAVIAYKAVSSLDGTVKYGLSLSDGEVVESVLMPYKHGWSQCLSTQAGCRMGCAFCATGIDGRRRNLLPAEMTAQIETAQADHGIRVSSLVLMGMGEPLDNYDHVLRFLYQLGEPGGVQIGMRHVSLSTCGLVDRIRELMQHRLQLTLSVSLHAPNNAIRDRLMPVNRRFPIEELLQACREYSEVTGRRVSFEYALLDGVNDSDACAAELAGRLKGTLCHVNLIPANRVEGKPYCGSPPARIAAFQKLLLSRGINTTVRRSLGRDIQASCGQLRRTLTSSATQL